MCRKIASACGDMDVEKAYILGLLHDIGREFGVRHLGHVYDGYVYMKSLGYDGEIKDMIMRLLQNENSKMDTDPNQVGWRKYHVLKALLESNEIIGKGEELERELKNILSQVDRISSKDKKRSIELGFISRENKHNKLYFHGDDRYMITLGKTPEDSHAAANAASIAINTIVC